MIAAVRAIGRRAGTSIAGPARGDSITVLAIAHFIFNNKAGTNGLASRWFRLRVGLSSSQDPR